MKIEFIDGKLTVWDDKGKVVVGVVQATIYLQEDGRKEAMLYVNLNHVKCDGLERHADGVRDGGTRDARIRDLESEHTDGKHQDQTMADCILCTRAG